MTEPPMGIATELLSLDDASMRAVATHEAVTKLGLLRPEAEPTLAGLIDDQMVNHPRAICLAYRKAGNQVSKELKKDLGIRANASISEAALSDLTEQGRTRPLDAHEVTLLRATFSVNRYRSILALGASAVTEKSTSFVYDVNSTDCPACAALEGKEVRGHDALVLPPEGCRCETANYALRRKVDWLADLD